MRKRFDKFGIESDMVGWIVIAVVVLAISFIGILQYKSRGVGAIDYIKNLLRLRS